MRLPGPSQHQAHGHHGSGAPGAGRGDGTAPQLSFLCESCVCPSHPGP